MSYNNYPVLSVSFFRDSQKRNFPRRDTHNLGMVAALFLESWLYHYPEDLLPGCKKHEVVISSNLCYSTRKQDNHWLHEPCGQEITVTAPTATWIAVAEVLRNSKQ